MIFNSKRRGESDIILTLHHKVHGEPIARMTEVERQNKNGGLKIWFDFRHAIPVITCSTVGKGGVRISERSIKLKK